MLEPQERILCAHRRLFRDDGTRYFLGIVEAYDAGMVRATGYSFIRDNVAGTVIRKPELRTKLLAVRSGMQIVYVLPRNLDIDAMHFEQRDLEIVLTDSAGFEMDLSERPNGD